MARPPSSRRSLVTSLIGAMAAVAGLAPRTASGDVFDLTLARFVKAPPMGGFADPATDAAAQAGYRQLLSELGVALAPKILTTADTVGYNGFQFDIDYSFTTISNNRCDQLGVDAGTADNPMNQDRCPWQFGVEGGRDAAGNRTRPPGLLHALSVYARKGIWLPLPSFEIGAGATKLMGSNLYAVQVYGKFSLHEGFHDWPIPSLAIRGSGLRVLGESSVDLTMAQIDATISKSFGIAGTVTLVPYVGAAWLVIVPRGQVLDITPAHDAFRDGPGSTDLNNNAVFPSSANENIQRWRFFGGFRLNYDILVLSVDYIATACGDLSGSCPAPGMHGADKVPDNSPWQHTLSIGAGFLF